MKKLISSANHKVLIEKLKTGRYLVAIASSKKVLLSHAYGVTKFQAMLQACRRLNSQLANPIY